MNNISKEYKKNVKELFERADIVLSDSELENIDYADFGLDNIEKEALNLVVYVNNKRYCAKEMVLLPRQTCPEHLHPDLENMEGKQETFRCRWGKVYLYVEGEDLKPDEISATLPKENSQYYTAGKEIVLTPGEQYTIDPRTKHWFQAGPEGAVISEFSSPSYDEYDVFTNPNIKREVRDR